VAEEYDPLEDVCLTPLKVKPVKTKPLLLRKQLKFRNAKDLEERINQYFDSCLTSKIDMETGLPKLVVVNPPTLSGLALFLNVNRATIWNYSKREEYVNVINWAKERIHSFNEGALYTQHFQGAKFVLTNTFPDQWADKRTIDHGISDKTVEYVDRLRRGKERVRCQVQ